jgi:hypothetical protein
MHIGSQVEVEVEVEVEVRSRAVFCSSLALT